MTPAEEITFVDTNVLVYAHDPGEPVKHPVAREVVKALWERRAGVVSTQVLSELYVVTTRKLSPPMDPAAARELVSLYAAWSVVRVDTEMILDASRLEERAQVSFWDAMIVEAARRAGATRLLTEDMQSGRSFDSVRIEDPFEAA